MKQRRQKIMGRQRAMLPFSGEKGMIKNHARGVAASKNLAISCDNIRSHKDYKTAQAVTWSLNKSSSPPDRSDRNPVDKLENLFPELQAFSEIQGYLENMNKVGKVDTSVIPKFEYLIDRMKK